MNNRSVYVLLMIVSFSVCTLKAQEAAQEKPPLYITVTTLHGVSGFDFEAWKEIEEEYFEKVTSKIDLIRSHEVLISYFSPRFSEIKIINLIDKWQDISDINKMRLSLIEEAWPDEEERKQFFEKQNSFYTSQHSDEIYLNSDFSKHLTLKPGQNRPLTFMIKTNILSDQEDENSYENYEKYIQEVTHKNPKVMAYYPFKHFWGADSREFVEITIFDSFADVEYAKYEGNALLSEMIPDEEERKQFLTSLYSAVESQETSFYLNVPTLSK